MISIDLRHATIICTPVSLNATLELLHGAVAASIDARLSNVIVLDEVTGEHVAQAMVPTEREIAAVQG